MTGETNQTTITDTVDPWANVREIAQTVKDSPAELRYAADIVRMAYAQRDRLHGSKFINDHDYRRIEEGAHLPQELNNLAEAIARISDGKPRENLDTPPLQANKGWREKILKLVRRAATPVDIRATLEHAEATIALANKILAIHVCMSQKADRIVYTHSETTAGYKAITQGLNPETAKVENTMEKLSATDQAIDEMKKNLPRAIAPDQLGA
jgi:hypothetical protein